MSKVLANPDLGLVLVSQRENGLLLGELERSVRYSVEEIRGKKYMHAISDYFDIVGKGLPDDAGNPHEVDALKDLSLVFADMLSWLRERETLEGYLHKKGFVAQDWDDKEQEKFLQQHGVQYDTNNPQKVQVKLTPYPL